MGYDKTLNNERIQDLTVYQITGSRYYGRWHGLPQNKQGLNLVFNWLRCFFGGLEKVTVAELHPNGGIWTHAILQVLKTKSVPDHMTYYILGEEVEHKLTHRDGIQVFDKDIQLNKKCRVRKYPVGLAPKILNPTLISEVFFRTGSIKEVPKPLDAVFCFESLHCFDKRERSLQYHRISKSIVPDGVFIGSVGFNEKEYDKAMLSEHGFILDKNYAVHRGHYYFQAIKESI